MIDVRQSGCGLIGMGVLPCELPAGVSAQTLGLDGTERFSLTLGGALEPRCRAELGVERVDGRREAVPVIVRLDTPIEAAYLAAGGILPYVLEQLLAGDANAQEAFERGHQPGGAA